MRSSSSYMRWPLSLLLLAALWAPIALLAEESKPNPQANQAPKVTIAKRGTFYLGILTPYPASFGIGATHYFFGDHLGLALELGKGDLITYALGVRLRLAALKLSPILGVTWSKGAETALTEKGFLYLNTGVDWKWDNGMFVHLGLNWTVTPKAGTTEMKPYIHFGFAY